LSSEAPASASGLASASPLKNPNGTAIVENPEPIASTSFAATIILLAASFCSASSA
jgi:hypothetical protein